MMKGFCLLVFLVFSACGLTPEARAKMILETGIADPSPIVRIHAAVGLDGNVGSRVLTEVLHSGDDDVASAALNAAIQNVGLLPKPEVSRACSSTNPSVREAAYRILAAGSSFDARALLVQGVQDDVAGIRAVCYEGLASFGETDILKNGLHDPETRVRIAAAKALGKSGAAGMPEFIKDELKKSAPDLLGTGIIAMAELGDTASIPLFRALLQESGGELRIDAAEALLILGDNTGVDVLKKALRSNDPFVRIHAASVFTKHEVPGTTLDLESAVRDEFVNVAVQAVRALAAHDALDHRQEFVELMNAESVLLRIEAAAAYLRSLDGA
jgi:HEAT repeat protein